MPSGCAAIQQNVGIFVSHLGVGSVESRLLAPIREECETRGVFTRVDRVQLAAPSRRDAAAGWVRLLGAEHDRDDRVAVLGALRSTYRLGSGFVEILEPDGAGRVADAVAARGAHLYAAGVATDDLGAFVARLRPRGADPAVEGAQAFLDLADTGNHGLRLVVSTHRPGPCVGEIDFFYEVTNLVHDAAAVTAQYADRFGLDAAAFVPIASPHYGYAGTLTLFDRDRLDRLEVITPDRPGTTMYRFFERVGESLYMAFAESGRLAAIAERVAEAGAKATLVPAAPQAAAAGLDTIFLHPPALGGMMLGLSRRTHAWIWSGHPERVEPAS